MLYWLTQLSDKAIFLTCFVTLRFEQEELFTALLFGFLFGRPLIIASKRNKAKANLLEMMARQRILRKLELLQWEVC